MADPSHKATSHSETEIWNAIAAFEKILEALPNDRVSLETLADAYEKVGDHTRAKDFILRLANVLIDEGDEDAALDLRHQILNFGADDPQVRDILSRLDGLKSEKVMALVMDEEKSAAPRPANIAGEIAFAWNLLQAKKLTQEEYTGVVHDLTEHSGKQHEAPISVLHALHDQNFAGLNEVIAFVATTCNLPVVSLSNFEIPPKTAALLPLDFIIRRGALVFELMGDDVLAGILNPYDTQLPIDIEDVTEKTCHCFLVSPEEFDAALTRIRKLTAAAGQAEDTPPPAKPGR